jgi:nitroreductase
MSALVSENSKLVNESIRAEVEEKTEVTQQRKSFAVSSSSNKMSVSQAVLTRQSIRQFIPDKVPDMKVIREILNKASRSASGGNLQPWKVYIVVGEKRDELVEKVVKGRIEGEKIMGEKPQVSVYPVDITDPYKARRTALGSSFYSTLGIDQGDTEKRSKILSEYFL